MIGLVINESVYLGTRRMAVEIVQNFFLNKFRISSEFFSVI